MVFTNNDAETFDGGAIYLLSFSHIVLSPGAKLHFINNTGRYGMYVRFTNVLIFYIVSTSANKIIINVYDFMVR